MVTGQVPARPEPRRSDAGRVRLHERDVTGLLLCAEHYAAPYDLLAAALDVQPPRLRGIVARWRSAGYARPGTLGPGPAWCWLTREGMAACGMAYPARPPALARLAHIRAVLAARLWLQAGQAYRDGRAWWQSERRIRAALPANVGIAHLPDAEIHWPSIDGSPYAGQVWAIEVELTPKPAARTNSPTPPASSPKRPPASAKPSPPHSTSSASTAPTTNKPPSSSPSPTQPPTSSPHSSPTPAPTATPQPNRLETYRTAL